MPDEAKPPASPQELFTARTFGTLGGCVMAAGVVATVICAVFGTDPKVVGLLVSIAVAFVPVIMKKQRQWFDHLIAPFNGCLIYLTLVGASSFYPYLKNGETPAGSQEASGTAPSAFKPWVPDRNLVKATEDLAFVAREQGAALNQVSNSIVEIERQTQGVTLSAPVRTTLDRQIQDSRALLHVTATNISSRVPRLNTVIPRP